jgi:hypothetical protein
VGAPSTQRLADHNPGNMLRSPTRRTRSRSTCWSARAVAVACVSSPPYETPPSWEVFRAEAAALLYQLGLTLDVAALCQRLSILDGLHKTFGAELLNAAHIFS